MKLSAVIITCNEEKNIGRCLKSLHGLVDEIVVVDSGSQDRTETICNAYGVRFIFHPWAGFSEQKNFANEQAVNDWIFSIDADEAVDETLQQSILQLKETGFSGAYSVDRLTNYCGRFLYHCWRPDNKIRIWNRNEGRWTGNIHETIDFGNRTPVVTRLNGDLAHYTYYTISEHLARIDKYSDLTASDAFRAGKKAPSTCGTRFRTGWRFLRDYIFKGGFRDGYEGYMACKISALGTFLKYTKLRFLYQTEQ